MKNEERLKRMILDIASLDIDIDCIDDDTLLIEGLGYDSVKLIELIIEIENEFEIEIDDDYLDIGVISSYKKLRDVVEKKCFGSNIDKCL